MRPFAFAATLLCAGCLPAEYLRIEYIARNMDCASCVDSLDGRLKKIKGVKSAESKPQEGRVTVVLAPENTVRLERVRDDIKNAGFPVGEARVVVRGRIVTAEGKWRLEVAGIEQVLAVSVAEAALIDKLREAGGKTITLAGSIPPPPDPRTQLVLEISAMLP